MLETELVDKITLYLNKHHIRNSKEIRMGIGVPDIVINIGASKKMTPINDYYLLAICEYIDQNGKATLCDLSSYFSIEKTKMTTYLHQLVVSNIILLNKNAFRLKRKIYNLNLGKTISIEAKIKDWRNGLLQAQRYLFFSDYSYLVLPEDKIKNVNLDEVQEHGIGLISVKVDGKLEEIVHPIVSSKCEYKQKYLVTSTIMKNNRDIIKRKKDLIFSELL